jgi:hypothetical protein
MFCDPEEVVALVDINGDVDDEEARCGPFSIGNWFKVASVAFGSRNSVSLSPDVE